MSGHSKAAARRNKRKISNISTVDIHAGSSPAHRWEEEKGSPSILRMKRTGVAGEKQDNYCWNFDSKVEKHINVSAIERILYPMTKDSFIAQFYEKEAFCMKRGLPDFFSNWISKSQVDQLLCKNELKYGLDLTVSRVDQGFRKDFVESSLDGSDHAVANPEIVFDRFKEGYSIRMLCPQKFFTHLLEPLSFLENEFSSVSGVNLYLTPTNSQGFAPHYDDVDAFILQIEGRKKWKVYAPPSDTECLPRFSSNDFTETELRDPTFETVLSPGDILYLPRGFIHQASCADDTSHSLHLTLSIGQRNTAADMLELVFPEVIDEVIRSNIMCRKSLPPQILNHLGVVNSEKTSKEREDFVNNWRVMCQQIFDLGLELMDAAADQMAKGFVSRRVPLLINSSVVKIVDEASLIRARAFNFSRMLIEEDQVVVHYKIKDCLGYDPVEDAKSLKFGLHVAPIVENMLTSKEFTSIRQCCLFEAEEGSGLLPDAVAIAKLLVHEGILEVL